MHQVEIEVVVECQHDNDCYDHFTTSVCKMDYERLASLTHPQVTLTYLPGYGPNGHIQYRASALFLSQLFKYLVWYCGGDWSQAADLLDSVKKVRQL